MKNACAVGSLALCWDSEIIDLRIEILGRLTASFLNLINHRCKFYSDRLMTSRPASSQQAKQTYLSSNYRVLSPLASHHSHITSLHLCFVSFMVHAQPPRPERDRVSLLPRGASSPAWSGVAPAKHLFWIPISVLNQGNPSSMSPDPSS